MKNAQAGQDRMVFPQGFERDERTSIEVMHAFRPRLRRSGLGFRP